MFLVSQYFGYQGQIGKVKKEEAELPTKQRNKKDIKYDKENKRLRYIERESEKQRGVERRRRWMWRRGEARACESFRPFRWFAWRASKA